MGRPVPKWPLDPDVIWQHFPVNNNESYLRGREDVIWQHQLLKIAMTHPFSGLRVRTVTINSNDVPPSNMFGHVPPHLSIKPCLDMTSFGNLLLLFIAMTYSGCDLRLSIVTKNCDDILTRACLCMTPLNMFGHVPIPSPVNKILSSHDVIWRRTITIYSDD